jgi:hypothetical protein
MLLGEWYRAASLSKDDVFVCHLKMELRRFVTLAALKVANNNEPMYVTVCITIFSVISCGLYSKGILSF